MRKLEGKVAVVAGSSRGIGAAIADPTQATRLVHDVVRLIGRLDILVTTAVMVNMELIGATG